MSEKKVIAKTTGDQKPQMTSEEKIEAGKAELEGTRTAAQTMRGQRVQGAADVQGEVSRGRDHGFFHDPKLRE